MAKKQAIKLLLGCGDERREGWVHQDRRARPGVDVVHDLETRPWPWADSSASHIEAIDLLEHLDDVVGFMDECWRVLEPGGTLFVRAVHAESKNLWLDPTHKRGFIQETFDYFDPERPWGAKYGHLYTERGWRLVECRDVGHAIEATLTPRKEQG